MRWDNLRIEREEGRTLPGFREPAAVRTFDAPEALGVRFYEVRARSAINKVPERSRMPFRFTINAYRGCAHACTYCADGTTPMLMADGRTKPMSDLRPGDSIYGTVREGSYRRYAITRVLDHWSVVKPAFRVVLEDGTELITSADHRFLTNRGWKHVIGAENGRRRRPHLTLDNTLMGTGAFAAQPEDTPDYRRGYLCGLIRGDGHIGSYSYERAGRARGDVHRFGLALIDVDALDRARRFLFGFGVVTDEFTFQESTDRTRSMRAIRNQTRDGVAAVKELIQWPRSPSGDWGRGFVAGIFDAEGSHGQVIRIANTDREIIERTDSCLRGLGFATRVERPNSIGVANVRLLGGLPARLRMFHSVDPAITRKRRIVGTAVKSVAPLSVTAIEPLGYKLRLFDITTGTGDFIANGAISHNCFARPSHTYLDFNAREDFEREIVVKVNAPELVRAELAKPSWKGEHVALGTNTDPYQWVEGRYRLTRGIWEAMRDASNPCSVLTKSPLLLRDLDLFRELVERTEFSANLSIPTLEEKAWRASEPHTPHPRKRIEAVAELNRAGVPTGVLIAPLMPGINDSPEQVSEILELCGEAGATSIGGIPLHLRGEVRDIYLDWLRSYRPDLVSRYEALYARGAYLPRREQERLTALARGPGGRKAPRGRRGRFGDAAAEAGRPRRRRRGDATDGVDVGEADHRQDPLF